jgi:hypothetical protein
VGEHTSDVGEVKGEWDPSLYAGSAAYYVQGRVPYTQELVAWLAELVARLLHDVLTRDGALVHVHATTHQGVESDAACPLPGHPAKRSTVLSSGFLVRNVAQGWARCRSSGPAGPRSAVKRLRSIGLQASPARPGSRCPVGSSSAMPTTSLQDDRHLTRLVVRKPLT